MVPRNQIGRGIEFALSGNPIPELVEQIPKSVLREEVARPPESALVVDLREVLLDDGRPADRVQAREPFAAARVEALPPDHRPEQYKLVR